MNDNDTREHLHSLGSMCVYLWETEGDNRRAIETYMLHALYSFISRNTAFQACNCVLMLVLIIATLHDVQVGVIHYVLLFAWFAWTLVAANNVLSLRELSRMYTDAVLSTDRARAVRATAVQVARQVSRRMAEQQNMDNDKEGPLH